MNSSTTNGAPALESTLCHLVDLFVDNSRDLRGDSAKIRRIIQLCKSACLEQPQEYVALLKFKRHIKKGSGLKMVWVIAMMVLYELDPVQYAQVLAWSQGSWKDCLRLARTLGCSKLRLNVEGPLPETDLMAQHIVTHLFEGKGKSNMLFKYVPCSGGHFDLEYIRVRNAVNAQVIARLSAAEVEENVETKSAVDPAHAKSSSSSSSAAEVEADVEAKSEVDPAHAKASSSAVASSLDLLREQLIFRVKSGQVPFTNATFRRFISQEKQRLHLVDTIFQHPSDDVEAVSCQLAALSTLAFKRVQNLVAKRPDSWLVPAYQRYLEKVAAKQVEVKTTGLSPVQDFYQRSLSALTLAQVEKIIRQVTECLAPYRARCDQMEVVIDVSGSMGGTPQQTAFFIANILVEAIGLTRVTAFATNAAQFTVTGVDLAARHASLWDGMNSQDGGSTNLQAAFDILLPNAEGKTVLILTDGDCDPYGGNNPFTTFLAQTQTTTVTVWNLKDDKMNFPYAALDRRVAYVSGNNVELIEPVLEALCKYGEDISPAKILSLCLSRPEFCFPERVVLSGSEVTLTPERVDMMVQGVLRNLPQQAAEVEEEAAAAAAARSSRAGRFRGGGRGGGRGGAAAAAAPPPDADALLAMQLLNADMDGLEQQLIDDEQGQDEE